MYTKSVSPRMGLAKIGSLCKACFRCYCAVSASGFQWKLLFSMHPLSVWKSGSDFPSDLEVKKLKAVRFQSNPCMSLRVCGDLVSSSSSTLVEISWIPSLVT